MSIKIIYSKKPISKSSNIVFFVNNKFNLSSIKNFFSKNEYEYVDDILKTSDLKKNLLVFDINSKKKIILISIKDNLKTSESENLGAEFYKNINFGKNNQYFLNTDSIKAKLENFLSHFLHGLKLKAYEFNKYKTI